MFNVKDYSYKSIINRNNTSFGSDLDDEIAEILSRTIVPTNTTYHSTAKKRSGVKQFFDALSIGNYATAGLVRGLLPNNDISVGEGVLGGIRASVPFMSNYEEGKHTYSDVLGDLGWKPTTTGGKIARGAVGFLGDVFLDPTTYLSGGLSALFKGSGKAGITTAHKTATALELAKEFGIKASDDIVEKLPGEVFDAVVRKYATKPNISKELVERLAMKKADDVVRILDKVPEGMSSELAEKIVVNSNKAKGITLGADDLARETEHLTKSYNKAIGLNTTAIDRTLSLGNAPFGKFLFRDLADKSTTVVTADTLKKIGDKTLAPQYAKLRSTFYGSKLGDLFSTKSTLFKLSKTNPGDFYDFLKSAERMKTITKNTQLLQKSITEKGKAFNLTPDETREVIELMEDESKWVQVKKAMKFSDMEEAKVFKAKILERQAKTQSQLDELLETKKSIDMLSEANDAKLVDAGDTLKAMREDYTNKLTSLKTSHITEQSKLQDLIKSYTDELDNLKLDEELLIKNNGISTDSIIKSYDDYKSAVSSDVANPFAKLKVVEDVSTYLFGRPDYITSSLWDAHFDKVANMIKNGDDKAKIVDYVEKNSEYFFSGRAQTVYPFIGEKLGYGKGKIFENWNEMYYDRIKHINEKVAKAEPLTVKDEQLLAELQSVKMQRDGWLQKFRNQDSMEGVMKIISEDKNKEMFDDYEKYKHMANTTSTRVSERTASELAEQRKIFNDYASPQNKIPDKIEASGKLLTSKNKLTVLDDLFERTFITLPDFDPNNIKPSYLRYTNAVADEVEPLLENFFKLDFDNLSPKQKELLYSMAIGNANKRMDGAKVFGAVGDAERKALVKEAELRKANLRTSMLADRTKIGSTVQFKNGDEVVEGVVKSVDFNDDAKGLLTVVKNDGGVVGKVGVDQLTSVKINSKLLSADEIVKLSNISDDFVTSQKELTSLLDVKTSDLSKLDDEFKTSYKSILENYKQRSTDVTNQIKELYVNSEDLSKAFSTDNLAKIDELTNKVMHADEVLANDDAFETFMRSWIGDGKVEDIIDKNAPRTAEFMLDSDLGVSEKVAKIAQQLRNDFIEIGKSEVNIGQLNVGQLDEMMDRYLPHVLTDEGKKLFNDSEEFQQHLSKLDIEFNNFSMERTIKRIPDGNGGYIDNPNVTQINKYFSEKFGDVLKGKNAFVDDVSDIYITRALKNTRLLYDDKFSHEIVDTFSKDYTSELSEGYNIVMNPVNYRNTSSDVAQLNVSMEISNAVSDYLRSDDVIKSIEDAVRAELGSSVVTKEQNLVYKKLFGDKMGAYAKDFIGKNFPDSVRRNMFESELKAFNTTSTVGGTLDDLSTPIIKFNDANVESLNRVIDETKEQYISSIRTKLINYEKTKYFESYGKKMPEELLNRFHNYALDDVVRHIDNARNVADEVDLQKLDRISKNIDTLNNFRNPEIKQMNSAIIDKANQARLLQIQKDNSRFLQIYDKFTHFIKINQTSVLPSFHARNKMSNTFNNWLEVGADAVDVDFQRTAFRAIKNKGNVDGVLKITNADGSVGMIGWDDLYKIAEEKGVIGEGFFAKEIAGDATSKGLFKKLPAHLDPTDTKNFKPYKVGTSIGSTIEDQDRLIHFASQVSRGMSYDEASESVTKFLFDYSDLTAFEQTVMKRIIPYYTWMRKNSALQLEMMMEHPEKYRYVSKVVGGVEGMVDENDRINRDYVNDFAKDWVQTPFSVTNPEGRTETVLWNTGLPYMDISKIPNPLDPVGSVKNIFSQTNPLIKLPVEQMLNKNTFFDSPIVEEGGNQLTSRADHILSQLALYNTGKDLATKRGADLGLQVLNNTTGVKLLSYDYDMYKAMKIQKMIDDGTFYDRDTIGEKAVKGTGAVLLGAGGIVVDGVTHAFSKAVNSVADSANKDKPLGADEYTGAFRPISQSKYEKLSDKDKARYNPPTSEEAIAYNKKAVELEQLQLEKSGVAKKFIWSLFDKFNLGERNKEYKLGEIVTVTDGDTFKIKIGNETKSVRMLLIDTPETVDPRVDEPMPYGKEASNHSKSHFLGQDAKIYFDGEETDKYGRLLGYVEIDGTDMNNELLKEGLAQTRYLYEPPYDRLDKYNATEKEAYNQKKGLWSLDGYATPNQDDGYNMNYLDAIGRKLK